MFTQVKIAGGNRYFTNLIEQHDVLFSFGECFSSATPDTGHTWLPTRQPVVLSEWEPAAERRDVFTTIMNWSAYKPIRYQDRSFGQKDIEFKKFLSLPELVAPTLIELAAGQGKDSKLPRELLRHKGFQLVDPVDACNDLDQYRAYVRCSKRNGAWLKTATSKAKRVGLVAAPRATWPLGGRLSYKTPASATSYRLARACWPFGTSRRRAPGFRQWKPTMTVTVKRPARLPKTTLTPIEF